MERRRLQGALQGLSEGLREIGLRHAMDQFGQAAPMTGTGIKQGNVPETPTGMSPTAPNQGDASQMGSSPDDPNPMPGQEPGQRQPGDYIIPSRPSTLAQEAHPSQNPAMQLARRRLDPGLTSRRRLG